MKIRNYRDVYRGTQRPWLRRQDYQVTIHKSAPPDDPLVSFVLLDWSCRERFTTLDFLHRQDVPRGNYELIWVELYNRVAPEVLHKADVVISLGQRGMYHKHIGYNVAHLHARGEILTVCDSDAVYPRDFVSSILDSFKMTNGDPPIPLVLMHHQWRTSQSYPDSLQDAETLRDPQWGWWPLVPNAGACMSVRREDVTRFGGFDEHRSLRGYLCGPYDLGWRMVNAGWQELWHDTSVASWHFAHPDPVGTNGLRPAWERLREHTFPHVDLHALTAVDAFSTGRILPLQENYAIWHLRMRARRIGTTFEKKYARMTSPQGFSTRHVWTMRARLLTDMVLSTARGMFATVAEWYLPATTADDLKAIARLTIDKLSIQKKRYQPLLVASLAGYNVVNFKHRYYGIPQHIGAINFYDPKELKRPEIIVGMTRQRVENAVRRLSVHAHA